MFSWSTSWTNHLRQPGSLIHCLNTYHQPDTQTRLFHGRTESPIPRNQKIRKLWANIGPIFQCTARRRQIERIQKYGKIPATRG